MFKKLKAAAYSAIGALSASAVTFAQSTGQGLDRVGLAVGCMCSQLMGILPVVAMLMVIGAGVVYAAGQMLGSETRARANTWATAMLVGAVIGLLIVVVAPTVLNILYHQQGGTVIDSNLCTSASCTQ